MKFIRKNDLGEDEYYVRSLKRYGTKEELIKDSERIRPLIENYFKKQLDRYDK